MKILFILKKREILDKKNDIYIGLSSGLYNSVKFVSDMLKNTQIQSKIHIANDNNDIDREVKEYRPNYVIIEALWVVPEKFAVLQKLHPLVKWIVRIHSELPFIAGEGIAMSWIGEYMKHRNVMVACNAPRMLEQMKFYTSLASSNYNYKVIYLPNYYPTAFKQKTQHFSSGDIIHIGCFGAVRPLKNHLTQALASIEFATRINKTLHFHVNSDRLEMNGEPALRNLVGLFENISKKGHCLIHHTWQPHEEFKQTCATMDIGLQVSFSETFNIVSADLISQGVPILSSNELPWITKGSACDPTSSKDIVEKLLETYKNPHHNVKTNQESLLNYVNKTKTIWKTYFLGEDEDDISRGLGFCCV